MSNNVTGRQRIFAAASSYHWTVDRRTDHNFAFVRGGHHIAVEFSKTGAVTTATSNYVRITGTGKAEQIVAGMKR